MDTQRLAFLLISRFEGCSLVPYRCPAGRWTIGYGATHLLTGETVTQSTEPLTPNEADLLLTQDIRKIYEFVLSKTEGHETTPWQNAALVSFTYNVGCGGFASSELLHKLLNGDLQGAADEFLQWDKIHSQGGLVESPGLLHRREAERSMFLGEPFHP